MAQNENSSGHNDSENTRQGSGFRWSLHHTFNPRLHAAAAAPRRLREDLHQVIRGLSPLVERSQSMSLSTWLRHPRSHGNRSSSSSSVSEFNSSSTIPQSPTSNADEFVISMDEEPVGVGVHNANSNVQIPSNGNGESSNPVSADAGTNQQTNDSLRQSPELRMLISVAEKCLPFVLILLAKLIFDHKTGILVLVGLVVTFTHANAIIKREVGKQNKRNLGSLCAVAINLLTCIFFIYYVFEKDKLYYSLTCLLPTREQPFDFWELLWIVEITDFVLKFVTILAKIIVVVLPPQIVPFQKKGKYFLFIEQTSQLYRSFTPIHPWLYYLLEAYDGVNKIFGYILAFAYVISKVKDVLQKLKHWRSSFSKLMQSVSYGTNPSKEQLEATGNMCPICQDDFRQPTMLQCKHTFCEECVIMWFDRERTCPMCRAQIADDPTWRDGATTFFFQLF